MLYQIFKFLVRIWGFANKGGDFQKNEKKGNTPLDDNQIVIYFLNYRSAVSNFQIFSTYLGDLPIRAEIFKKMKKKETLPLMTTKSSFIF